MDKEIFFKLENEKILNEWRDMQNFVSAQRKEIFKILKIDLRKKGVNDTKKGNNYFNYQSLVSAFIRVLETTNFLLTFKISTEHKDQCWDFYSFIVFETLIIKSIEQIFILLDKRDLFGEIDGKSNIFEHKNIKNIKKNRDFSDFEYFIFLRSLTIEHPLQTNHKISSPICSAYCSWKNSLIDVITYEHDIVVDFMFGVKNKSPINTEYPFGISTYEFFRYLNYWLSQISELKKFFETSEFPKSRGMYKTRYIITYKTTKNITDEKIFKYLYSMCINNWENYTKKLKFEQIKKFYDSLEMTIKSIDLNKKNNYLQQNYVNEKRENFIGENICKITKKRRCEWLSYIITWFLNDKHKDGYDKK